ncbi:FG-GAP repeat domain-containing protein [Streptomyces sp. NBC_00271]|uniref:FG-GAP repeat domain-containing protein n=1 Tax=Streptomyces sp. NBC_00271 TaxID=2975697 RepID=UPI002E2C49E7|nr:VCBS repeat-containing protein [Streptomyces sp. NBC_00271]
MTRHAFVRLRLVAASAVLAAGLSPLLPSPTAVADAPRETVVPATLRSTYPAAELYSGSSPSGHDGAGQQGVFHTLEGSGLVWTRYADGTSVPVTRPTENMGVWGTGGDVLAYRYPGDRVDLWNAVDGTTRTLHVPSGLGLLTVFSDLAVAYRGVTDEKGLTWREMHLLLPEADGTTRDVPVSGVPAGVNLGAPVGGDADGLLFQGSKDGHYLSLMVDRHTGQVRDWTPLRSKVYLRAQVTAEHVVLFNTGQTAVQVFSRSDLSAAPTEVPLSGSGVNPVQDLAVVGDWLVRRSGGSTVVTAQPITGGPTVTLMPSSGAYFSAVSDGTAVLIGRTTADDWGVQRIKPGPDGSPVVTQVKALPKPPVKIQGLSLEQGRLLVADTGGPGGYRDDYVRTVAVTGTPEFGARSSFDGTALNLGTCPATEVGCSQLHGTADGRAAWLTKDTATSDGIRVNGPAPYTFWERSVPAGGRITDVSGQYLIHTTDTAQTVYKIGNYGTPALTRTPGAAALSGDTLWTPGTTPGTVTAYNLTTKKTTETLTIDAGCAPTELRANGRWLYWSCAEGTAGVYDRTAKRSVPVPAGEAELGDGFVVTHDRQAGQLVLTTVADGTPVSRVIGALPDTGISQREVRWTVDESTGNVAYVDGQERVHLVPTGVIQQPLRLLAPVDSASTLVAREIDTTPSTLTTLLLSKPAAGWRLTVRSRVTGKVVDTRDGGATRGEVKVGWFGTDAKGAFLTNGRYDWTLSVTPADGVGAPVATSGTVALSGAAPATHDYIGGGDFIGDLVTLSSSGTLGFRQGSGKGTFSVNLGTSSGWTTTNKVVPFGDLSGDRCNDVLVRLTSGALRAYKPDCYGTLKPSTAYTSLGTSGWNQYDVLTSPGDISGDGRPDLIARNAATGTVYLYKGTSTGKLSARVKLYANWKAYKKVVGVGDLNGDGIGDLLAQDKTNTLYRYYGTGKGSFGARAKVFAGWGGSYNVVVGAGDITGDGKADLVARDTAGNLYRQNGTGKGSFAARVKIGSGCQGYRGLF